MVEMKSLWKLWWPPWVVCSNDYVWNCFGKVNACTLGFFHPSPKKTHQPGQPVCTRPGDQLRTLASWGATELLLICDLYFSTWTSVQFFSLNFKDPRLVFRVPATPSFKKTEQFFPATQWLQPARCFIFYTTHLVVRWKTSLFISVYRLQ